MAICQNGHFVILKQIAWYNFLNYNSIKVGDYAATIHSDIITKGEYKDDELNVRDILESCVNSALHSSHSYKAGGIWKNTL